MTAHRPSPLWRDGSATGFAYARVPDRATFPRQARVLHPESFAAALRGQRLARGRLLAVHAAPSPHGQARLGLIVGKRQAPLAVQRNHVKRVVREAFRHLRHQLPALDLVVRLHARAPDVSATEFKAMLRAEIDGHLRRVLSRQSRPAPPSANTPPQQAAADAAAMAAASAAAGGIS